nr:MAG TPA_asm: hypothetical protein [Caudoviricetes sp.]
MKNVSFSTTYLYIKCSVYRLFTQSLKNTAFVINAL